jgi:hypothetical protein
MEPVKPPIFCPPPDSEKIFRIIDCKKIGIVQGSEKLTSINLEDFVVPISSYTAGEIIIKAGSSITLGLEGKQDQTYEEWFLSIPNEIGTSRYEYKFEIEVFGKYYSFLGVREEGADWWETLREDVKNWHYIDNLIYFKPENDGIVAVSRQPNQKIIVSLYIGSVYSPTGIEWEYQTIGKPLILCLDNRPKNRGFIIYVQWDKIDAKKCGCALNNGALNPQKSTLKWKWKEYYNQINTYVYIDEDLIGEKVNYLKWYGDHPYYAVRPNDWIIVDNLRIQIGEVVDNIIIFKDPSVYVTIFETIKLEYEQPKNNYSSFSQILMLTTSYNTMFGDDFQNGPIEIYNPQGFDIPIKWILLL